MPTMLDILKIGCKNFEGLETPVKAFASVLRAVVLWPVRYFQAGTGQAWRGWIAALLGVLLGVALLVWLAGQDPQLELSEWQNFGIAFVVVTPFIVGVAMLVNYYEARHHEQKNYTVTKLSQIGYVAWFATTSFTAVAGFSLLTAGNSPLSGAVSLFATIFLITGWTMAGWPKQGWPLRSLLLLKRICNWQIAAAGAIIALVFERPEKGQSTLDAMGQNFGLMMFLLISWVVGAALLTVLLEPLKYKLESLPKWLLDGWESGKIN